MLTTSDYITVNAMSAYIRGDLDALSKIRKNYGHLADMVQVFSNIDRHRALKGNGETFAASWKCLTITYKLWETNPIPLERLVGMLDKFLDKRFSRHCYTVERIHTNTHVHLAFEFTRKKLRKDVLIKQLRKFFKTEEFDFSLRDNKGHDHFKSKTLEQSRGYIGYIQKDQEDKIVKFSDETFEKLAFAFKK